MTSVNIVSLRILLLGMCLFVQQFVSSVEARGEGISVDADSLKKEGLVKIAQRLAGVSSQPVFVVGSRPASQTATTEASAEQSSEAASRAIGACIADLGPPCVRMGRQEFERTLIGLNKIIKELERQSALRALLCAIELRSKCLRILAARFVGLGEAPPDAAKGLLESQLSPEASKRILALLEDKYPQWKDLLKTISVPCRYKDWYALYNLGRTGETGTWPNYDSIMVAILSTYKDQSFRSNNPGLCELAMAVLTNEIERLRVVWLIHLKVAIGEFPKENDRDKFEAAVKAHVQFGAEDKLPFSDKAINATTLWKFYRQPLNEYQEWTEDEKSR